MPTYDYLCESCGNRFDVWQKMTDDPITLCPKCAGHVRRVIHPAGIVFKGSGFYSTDQRGASSAPSTPASSDAPAASTSTGESGGKPAEVAAPAATQGPSKAAS
jgi:putative FmdB family regulatory protein